MSTCMPHAARRSWRMDLKKGNQGASSAARGPSFPCKRMRRARKHHRDSTATRLAGSTSAHIQSPRGRKSRSTARRQNSPARDNLHWAVAELAHAHAQCRAGSDIVEKMSHSPAHAAPPCLMEGLALSFVSQGASTEAICRPRRRKARRWSRGKARPRQHCHPKCPSGWNSPNRLATSHSAPPPRATAVAVTSHKSPAPSRVRWCGPASVGLGVAEWSRSASPVSATTGAQPARHTPPRAA